MRILKEYLRFCEEIRDIQDLFVVKTFYDVFLRIFKKFQKTYCISLRYLLQYVVQLVFIEKRQICHHKMPHDIDCLFYIIRRVFMWNETRKGHSASKYQQVF